MFPMLNADKYGMLSHYSLCCFYMNVCEQLFLSGYNYFFLTFLLETTLMFILPYICFLKESFVQIGIHFLDLVYS